jgi:hypothetical protein
MSATETLARPHERRASVTLREEALLRYDPLRTAVAEAAKAVTRLRQDGDDIVVAMASVNVLSLAAEAIAAAAEDLHKTADAALVRAMETSGCTSIFSANLNVSLVQGLASVDVTDRAAVPPELWTTPEARPDLTKVRSWLKRQSGTVNWARLIPGKPHLRRTAA